MQNKKFIVLPVMFSMVLLMTSAGSVFAQANVQSGANQPQLQGQMPPAGGVAAKDGQQYVLENNTQGVMNTAGGKGHFSGPIRKGEKGADVLALQKVLIAKGLLPTTTALTGFFGPATQKAIQQLQSASGIANADGATVGPKTQTLLENIISELGGTIPTDPVAFVKANNNQNNQNVTSGNGGEKNDRPRPCGPGSLFDSMTGASCPAPKPVVSCVPGDKYDALTGKMCVIPVPAPVVNNQSTSTVTSSASSTQ